MPSRFVAPKRIESFEDVRKALARVQEQLDSGQSKRPALITTDTTLRAGESVRISPRGGATLFAKLPKASAENFGQTITLLIERPNGTVRVSAQAPDTVVGATATNFTTAGLVVLMSNGVDAWVSAAELPSTSPGGAALDAEYVLGAAHASLPNAAVGTDTAEVDFSFTPGGVATWVLNAASVAFSKLANLTGLSVLGRAANSAGVMAAITATAGYQALRSNATGTAIGWENYLPTSHIPASIAGLQNPYLLPAGFAHGDTLRLTITGDTTIRAILDSTGTRDTLPEGFEFNLCLSDQSGGSAPGWFLDIEDNAAVTGLEGFFRTPGQVQGTSPGPSYRMRSEEEGCRVAMQFGNWRIIGGTAGQLINGAVTVAAGNGSTRASQFSGIRDNGALETARGFLNFRDSNSLSAFVVQDSANDEMEVTFGRNALTGDVTAAFDSGVTAIAAGVIVDADVNASAAIAMTKTGALTGFAAKASGASATTSAEPIITYSASANMSAERVATDTTTVDVDIGTAGQVRWNVILSAAYAWTGDHSIGGAADWTMNSSGDFGVTAAAASIISSSTILVDAVGDLTLASDGNVVVTGDALFVSGEGFIIVTGETGSTPSLTAGQGMFWALDPGSPSTIPRFTRDDNVDVYLETAGEIISVSGTQNAAALGNADTIEFTTTGTLNGIANGYRGKKVDVFLGAGGATTLTVNHLSGSAAASDQIALANGVAYGAIGRGGIRVMHDGSVWREIARAG